MNRMLFIASLIIVIIACSVLSVIVYPTHIEKYTEEVSDQQMFLLIKNYAYDIHAFRHFNTWANTNAVYSAPTSTSLPTFYAISGPCAKSKTTLDNFQCYDYNINLITVENKITLGVLGCTSIDNTIQAQDALAHTVRINNDVYLFHKSCVVAKHIESPPTPTPINIPFEPTTDIDLDASSHFDNAKAMILARGFALNSMSRTPTTADSTKYSIDEYTVVIDDSDVAKLIVLLRPMFLRFGTSCMYTIDYSDTTVNGINEYTVTTSSGKLTLKLRKVLDTKIYATNLLNLKEAFDLVKNSNSFNVDCKPKNILDPSDTFLSKYSVTLPVDKAEETSDKNPMNIMLYYLTHSQIVSMAKDTNTKCISMYFNALTFNANATTMFEFLSNKVETQLESGHKKLNLKGFGYTSGNEFSMSIPVTDNVVSAVITWSENRITCVVFYTTDNKKQMCFKSKSTPKACSLLKSHFDKACVDQKCNIGSKSSCCLISLYDFAKSKNLL